MMSFYTTGGTVQAGDGIYLPRPADTELLQLCQAGEFAYILTARQMGKSSLMEATAARLVEAGIVSVVIDLQMIGTPEKKETWYLGLLQDIADQLLLATDVYSWWQQYPHLGATQRLTRFFEEILLAETTKQIVVFVDEIDTTLSLNYTDDFFIAIRYFHEARVRKPELQRLSFVLVGVAMPGDLIKDSQRTPFNIGQRLDVEDFTLSEALPLAEGLKLPEPQAKQVLSWVLDWTGGHPYLTQRLCQVLEGEAEKQEGSLDWTKAGVEQVVRQTFLEGGDRSDRNLQFVRDRLTSPTTTLTSEDLLHTYRDILQGKTVEDDERSLIKSHLKLSGIVKQNNNRNLTLRNQLYQRIFDQKWVKANLPETWWQRNREVLRVAIPVTAVSVVGAISMGILSLVALHQRSLAQSQSIRAGANAAKFYFLSNQPLDGMITAVNTWQTVTNLNRQNTNDAILAHSALIHAAYYDLDFNRNLSQAVVEPTVLRAGFRERNSRDLPVGVRALSPDGKTIVVGYNSAELRSLSSEAAPIPLQAGGGTVSDAAFSPSGQKVAIASADGTVKIWNTQGQALASFDYSNRIHRVTFSPDGETIAIVGRGDLITLWNPSWNSSTGTNETLTHQEAALQDVVFSPDGRILATASRNGNISLWDTTSKQLLKTLRHGTNPVNNIAISPDGTILAAANDQGRIKLWDIRSGQATADFSHRDPGNTAIFFNPDSTLIAAAGQDGAIQLWNRSGTLLQTLESRNSSTSRLAFSDKNTLISAGNILTIWSRIDNFSQPLIQSVEAHEGSNGAIAFSPDGTLLASAGNDASFSNSVVKILTRSGDVIGTLENGDVEISAIAFGPNNNTLAIGDTSGQVKLWKFKASAQAEAIGEHRASVIGLSFHPTQNTLLAIDETGEVKRRNLNNQTTHKLAAPDGINYITSAAFSPDGNTVAIAADDNTIHVSDKEGQQIAMLDFQSQESQQLNRLQANNTFSALAFSPEGDMLAWANADNRVTLWTRDGQLLKVLNSHQDNVTDVAFSANGHIIATSSNDGSLRLWNPKGELLNTLDGDQDGQRDVRFGLTFSPVDNTLATVSDTGFIEFWELTPQRLVAWNCHWLQDYLQSNTYEQLTTEKDLCQTHL